MRTKRFKGFDFDVALDYPVFLLRNTNRFKDEAFHEIEITECQQIPRDHLDDTHPFVAIPTESFVRVNILPVEKGNESIQRLHFTFDYSDHGYIVFRYSPNMYIERRPNSFFEDTSVTLKYAFVSFSIPVESSLFTPTFIYSCTEKAKLLQEKFEDFPVMTIDNFCPAKTVVEIMGMLKESRESLVGPPDFCRFTMCSPDIDLRFLYSDIFITYLKNITGLEIKAPAFRASTWKLEKGSYWMLNEDHGDRDKEGLDLILCFCETEPLDPDLAAFHYINKEDGEVLAKIAPTNNSMSLAYRTEGAARFIRYIPKSSADFHAPVYYICVTYQLEQPGRGAKNIME